MADSIFTAADIERLFEERFLHPHPMIQKKLEALYSLSEESRNEAQRYMVRVHGGRGGWG